MSGIVRRCAKTGGACSTEGLFAGRCFLCVCKEKGPEEINSEGRGQGGNSLHREQMKQQLGLRL